MEDRIEPPMWIRGYLDKFISNEHNIHELTDLIRNFSDEITLDEVWDSLKRNSRYTTPDNTDELQLIHYLTALPQEFWREVAVKLERRNFGYLERDDIEEAYEKMPTRDPNPRTFFIKNRDRITLSGRALGFLLECGVDRNNSALYRAMVDSGFMDQIIGDITEGDVLEAFEFYRENSHKRNFTGRLLPHEQMLYDILSILPPEFSREIKSIYHTRGYLERNDIKVCYERLVGRSE